MLPAKVADVDVTALDVPVTTAGIVLTPDPAAATFIEAAPPPPTGILPS